MTTAIIVARAGSVRLPNKALLPFGESTLIGHKVRTLKNCRLIDRVVAGSDSTEILREAERHGAEPIRRDDFHCDESRCAANDMIADMIDRAGGDADDVIVWAHPTNPLVRSETYDHAVKAFVSRPSPFDSLTSVRVERRHAWFNGSPLNHQPWSVPHEPASKLRSVKFQDGAIFIQTRARFAETRSFYGDSPLLFPMPFPEWWDIDTSADYHAAIALSSLYADRDTFSRAIASTVSRAERV